MSLVNKMTHLDWEVKMTHNEFDDFDKKSRELYQQVKNKYNLSMDYASCLHNFTQIWKLMIPMTNHVKFLDAELKNTNSPSVISFFEIAISTIKPQGGEEIPILFAAFLAGLYREI